MKMIAKILYAYNALKYMQVDYLIKPLFFIYRIFKSSIDYFIYKINRLHCKFNGIEEIIRLILLKLKLSYYLNFSWKFNLFVYS